jgi:hypothetical protein
MARIATTIKINNLRGPRLPYNPAQAEIADNEYVYLTADGIAVPDGEGILYWIDTIVTTDGGGSTVHDETSAAGNKLGGAYAAKAVDGVHKTFNPPKKYNHGIYVDVDNSEVEICYRPYARNLRCRVTCFFIPMTFNLVSKVTVVYAAGSINLVSRVSVAYTAGTSNLVSRATVVYATASKDLVSMVTVQAPFYTEPLVCQVSVAYVEGTSDLVSKVAVLKADGTTALMCKVYANRVP